MAIKPGDDNNERNDVLQNSAPDIGCLGFEFGPSSQGALDDGRIADPISRTENQCEAKKDPRPWKWRRRVDGQHQRSRFYLSAIGLLASQFELMNFLLQGGDATDIDQAEGDDQKAADDHDDALDRVGIDDGGQTAGNGVDADQGGSQQNARRLVPAKQDGKQFGRGQQHNAQVAGHEDEPTESESSADTGIKTLFHEFGNGVDAEPPEVRNEDESSDDHGWHTADPFEVANRQAIAVGSTADADDIGAANIGGDEGHADRPPWQQATGEEIIGTRTDAPSHPQPERENRNEVDSQAGVIERR
ncbi:MAG: hypothetical protein KatS3mg105_0204 [Gemmatales bacterium]|nr:MAG: hypothetical protein KatS3mg105_0204 [Gemmatales bacterium]